MAFLVSSFPQTTTIWYSDKYWPYHHSFVEFHHSLSVCSALCGVCCNLHWYLWLYSNLYRWYLDYYCPFEYEHWSDFNNSEGIGAINWATCKLLQVSYCQVNHSSVQNGLKFVIEESWIVLLHMLHRIMLCLKMPYVYRSSYKYPFLFRRWLFFCSN